MTAVLKANTGVAVAESVLTDIITKNSKYYYYLGRILSWNPSGAELPEVPMDNHKYELDTRSKIIFVKRITESDVALVIPRYDWTQNTVYDMYDDAYSVTNLSSTGKSSLDESMFYVVTDESNVYKCISNNYGKPSMVRPSGIDTTIFITSDSYEWKFMYNIPVGFKNKFLQSNYIPVTTAIKNQFYSQGAIGSITIDNTGSGYVSGSTLINVSGDGYIEENPYILSGISITSGGFGYTATPTLAISPPVATIGAEVQATATSILVGGIVTSASLTNIGYGYTESATIITTEPILGAVEWTQTTVYPLNAKVKFNDNYYNVSTAGTSGYIAPTHTTSTAPNGNAVFTYQATRAKLYLTHTKTEASINPIISGGQIIGAVVVNSGKGYTYASLNIVGVGSGANLTVNLSTGDLDTIQSNVELLAVDGLISGINVDTQGTGYSTASVVIEGDGIGAVATAVLDSGKIIRITMNNRGSGYTYANISIVGNGSGSIARAIMSPVGGHGKNAVMELYARTLMFFTSISSEKNQGITVNNDNRQIGIIKAPTKFNSDLLFRDSLGSSCYLLIFANTVNQLKFYPDLKLNTSNKEYYIVSVEDNKILISSGKNFVPQIGETLSTPTLDIITPIGVIPPTIDKYSGNMLFIDNRNAFNTTSEQSLSLRTTIMF